MSKHIVDGKRPTSGTGRVQQFTRLDASRHPSPQAKQLQRRAVSTDPQKRALEFIKIERRAPDSV